MDACRQIRHDVTPLYLWSPSSEPQKQVTLKPSFHLSKTFTCSLWRINERADKIWVMNALRCALLNDLLAMNTISHGWLTTEAVSFIQTVLQRQPSTSNCFTPHLLQSISQKNHSQCKFSPEKKHFQRYLIHIFFQIKMPHWQVRWF